MPLTSRIGRLLILVLVLVAITVAVIIAVTTSLYRTSFAEQRDQLVELVESQAALIAAVARVDAQASAGDPVTAREATLSQIRAAWQEGGGFGDSGEFVVARRVDGAIEFLYSSRSLAPLPRVPSEAAAGEPMRRALRGESGTVIGPDYAGSEVLAAYAWVEDLQVGLVAKTDLREVQTPLWRSTLIGAGIGGALVLLGSLLLLLVGERLERDLRRQRKRYLALFEGSPDGQFVISDNRYEDVNEVACSMLLRTHEEIVGRTLGDFSPKRQPDGRPSPDAAAEKIAAVRDGGTQSFEWQHLRGDGRLLDTEITLKSIELDGERRILANVRDITARKARHEFQQRLLTVLEQTDDGVGMADADGGVFYINAAGREMMGIGPGVDVTQFTVNDFQEDASVRNIMEAAARDGVWRGEVDFRRLDGSTIAISEVVTAHRDETDELRYFSTIARDVSARREADAERRRLATAIDQITEGILITDAGGRIEYVNDALTQITGYARNELVGETPSILKSGHQDESFYERLWETIRAGKVWEGQLINRRKDGSFYEEEMTITPVRGEDGEIHTYVAAKRDVTERVLLESQLQQAQKMEAIGQLAGGVAHDFNNMLTGITGYAQLLMHNIEGERDRADLQQVLELSMRAAGLTQQLLAFSRRQQLEKSSVDLDALVNNTLKMLRRLIPEDIEVSYEGDEDLRPVLADSGQLVQVIMNLAVNARDAMPSGGKLVIETANVDLDEEYAAAYLDVAPGRYAMLSLTDTGGGMDDDTRRHIFEPFFTTKGAGEGTGLGLATVYGIVKQHGGHITVYSEPGVGSAFKVYLPASGVAADVQEASLEGPTALPEIATVLLVEDEEAVREIVERSLAALGCHVLSAGRSSEAREMYEAAEKRVELLLTDVVMPGGLGTDLFRELSSIDPELQVIFMSGYPDRGAVHLTDLPTGAAFLRKPFSPGKLAEQVRKILTERAN